MTIKMRDTSFSVPTMLLKNVKESDNKKYTWRCMKTGIWEVISFGKELEVVYLPVDRAVEK